MPVHAGNNKSKRAEKAKSICLLVHVCEEKTTFRNIMGELII